MKRDAFLTAAARRRACIQCGCQCCSRATVFQRDLHEFGLVIARLTLALVVVVLADPGGGRT